MILFKTQNCPPILAGSFNLGMIYFANPKEKVYNVAD